MKDHDDQSWGNHDQSWGNQEKGKRGKGEKG
jgi:hypothetical protein